MWGRTWAPRGTVCPGQALLSLSGSPETWSPSTSGHPHPHQIFNNTQCHQCDINIFTSHPVGRSPFMWWQGHRQMSWGGRMESLGGLHEQWLWRWSLDESFRKKENPEDWLAWEQGDKKSEFLMAGQRRGAEVEVGRNDVQKQRVPDQVARSLRFILQATVLPGSQQTGYLQLHTVQEPQPLNHRATCWNAN